MITLINNTLRIDPTRTTMIRRRFMAEMTSRFKRISRTVWKLLVQEDALGLNPRLLVTQELQAWRFHTDSQKITAYRDWLQKQTDAGILSVDVRGDPWTAKYVESSYKKGVQRAYVDVNKTRTDFYEGTQSQFLQEAFHAPETLSKLALLNTRTFEELRGVTAAMSQQMGRTLADGLAKGQGPVTIAREMTKVVEGITRKRANVIARTEVIHAHAEGQLDAFDRLGVEELNIVAEWSTAGDDRVCARCGDIEGETMTVDEARGLIPLHPNCRCMWKPAEEKKKEVEPSLEYRIPEALPETPEVKALLQTETALRKKTAALRKAYKGGDKSLRPALMRSKKELQAVRDQLAKAGGKVPTPVPTPKPTPSIKEVKLPTEGLNRKMDPRYAEWVREDFEQRKKLIQSYNAGKEKILAQVSSKEYTVTITDNNRMIYTWHGAPTKPIPSGNWMDWWEPAHKKYFGVAKKEYVTMSRSKRALLEARLQLKMYPHEQFFDKYVSFYLPEKYGNWWWDLGGKGGSWVKRNAYWKKQLLKKTLKPVVKVPMKVPKVPTPAVTGRTKFASAEDYRQYLINQVKAAKTAGSQGYVDDLTYESQSLWNEYLKAKYVKGSPESKAHWAKIKAVDKELKAARKAMTVSKEAQRKLLDEVDSMIGRCELLADKTQLKKYQSVTDEILSWIPKKRATSREFSWVNLEHYSRSRNGLLGSYNSGSRLLSMFTNSKQVFAHEFGHHLSYQLKGFMQAQGQFFNSRTVGEKTVRLFKDIWGKKDRWKTYDVYAGKIYKSTGRFAFDRTPEVASVGIEHLWANPYRAATKDPEWFNMIISQLKGIPVK